jgi:hypothetical protein
MGRFNVFSDNSTVMLITIIFVGTSFAKKNYMNETVLVEFARAAGEAFGKKKQGWFWKREARLL